jgi:hypothetical protein
MLPDMIADWFPLGVVEVFEGRALVAERDEM